MKSRRTMLTLLAASPFATIAPAAATFELMRFDPDRTQGYPAGALIRSASGRAWVSAIDNNLIDPDVNAEHWVPFPDAAMRELTEKMT